MGTRHEHEVAMKWSCFPDDRFDLEDRAPRVLGLLIEGIDEGFLEQTGDSFEIAFRSTKEIRYGRVTIVPTREGLVASGKVWDEWDDPADLADTLECDEDDLREFLPFTESGEPGVEREFRFPVLSTDQLLEQLEAEESELIKASQAAWTEIDATMKKNG